MIAMYGLPGSSLFSFARVKTREEGYLWIRWMYDESGQDHGELNAYISGRVVTNKVATAMRWQSKQRVFRSLDTIPTPEEWKASERNAIELMDASRR